VTELVAVPTTSSITRATARRELATLTAVWLFLKPVTEAVAAVPVATARVRVAAVVVAAVKAAEVSAGPVGTASLGNIVTQEAETATSMVADLAD